MSDRILVINPNSSVSCTAGIAAALEPFATLARFEVTRLADGPPAIVTWRDWFSVAEPLCRLVEREAAAAYVIACARTAPGREDEWAARLRETAPTATPNPLIVALADRLLDRGGAMVRAAHAIGRGVETYWGAPFELDLTAEGDGRR